MKKIFLLICVVSLITSCAFLDWLLDSSESDNNTGGNSSNTDGNNSNTDGDPVIITENDEQRMAEMKRRYAAIPKSFPNFFTVVPTTSPYNAGKVKPEVLQAGLDSLNLMRYIARLPDDIVLDDTQTDKCQHGAVLLTVLNQLTHFPEKPADMPQAFFDKGADALATSNLAGYNTPHMAIEAFMSDEDTANRVSVGHRRRILNPSMKKTGFGVGAARFFVQYATDSSRETDVNMDYVAWPAPGLFPSTFATGAWHITANTEKYGRPDIDKVKVIMRHVNSGRECVMSKDSLPQYAYFNVYYRGIYDHAVIFSPVFGDLDLFYLPGNEFQITVTGLKEDIHYTVKLFNIEQ